MQARRLILVTPLLLFAAYGVPAQDSAQQAPPQQDTMPGMTMPMPAAPQMNAAGMFLMQQTSGTGANPGSAPMNMINTTQHGWDLMFHGQGFISDVQQTGPRGADKFLSTNWFMGVAERKAGRGTFMIRAMFSLEPATITGRYYPELFQTGETAFGIPLVDGQHPHNFFMELALAYARTLNEHTTMEIYFAPVGDPALGPVAFPHRESASELPQAPLGHHLQDSTHIADDVITVLLHRTHWGAEASAFHGAEPGENRWIIQQGAPDSWSGRLDWTPTQNWSVQISAGRLHNPEAFQPGDIIRSTASVSYNRPFDRGDWATSVIWGRNHETATQRNLNSYLLESVVRFRRANYVTGRAELVDRDELFVNQPEIEEQLVETTGTTFRVGAFTAGYTRDVHLLPRLITGIGGNFTLYRLPDAIQPYYGEHPIAVYGFLRFRLEGTDSSAMHKQTTP